MKIITCCTGGGTQGEPGPAVAVVSVVDEGGAVLTEVTERLGNANTQFAEYYGAMLGLQTLISHFGVDTQQTQFDIRLANEVVKKQLNAESQITEPGLVPMFIEIHNLCVAHFPHLTFSLLAPAEQTNITRLVDEALDGK